MGTKFPSLVTKFGDLTIQELCVINNLASQMDTSIERQTCDRWNGNGKDKASLIKIVTDSLDKVKRYACVEDNGEFRLVPQSDDTENSTIAKVKGDLPLTDNGEKKVNLSEEIEKDLKVTKVPPRVAKGGSTKQRQTAADKKTPTKVQSVDDKIRGAKVAQKSKTKTQAATSGDNRKIRILAGGKERAAKAKAGNNLFKRFLLYKDGMTIVDFLKLEGAYRVNLMWHVQKGWIAVE